MYLMVIVVLFLLQLHNVKSSYGLDSSGSDQMNTSKSIEQQEPSKVRSLRRSGKGKGLTVFQTQQTVK
ncbi:hypothetical protein ACA910_003249 [Epithemia clementina (nom. ined.)]